MPCQRCTRRAINAWTAWMGDQLRCPYESDEIDVEAIVTRLRVRSRGNFEQVLKERGDVPATERNACQQSAGQIAKYAESRHTTHVTRVALTQMNVARRILDIIRRLPVRVNGARVNGVTFIAITYGLWTPYARRKMQMKRRRIKSTSRI